MESTLDEKPEPGGPMLEQYGIHPETGFLPSPDPLDRLPEPFEPWEAAARDLPKFLASGKVRSFVDQLPVLDGSQLSDERKQRRAMVILSFLGHAYVWGEKQTIGFIPKCLAQPWHKIAKELGRPPVLSYASYALDNWRRLHPDRPIEIGNICLRQNFLGGQDEEWFVLIHVAIEAKAAPAFGAILAAQQAVTANQPEQVASQLTLIAGTLETMYEILLRMPERCDPYIYFNRVRPYLHGWANHPTLPQGLIYEGVVEYGGKPQSFRGETGAQSSIIPACDAALGITHEKDILHAYLMEMRDYMPPRHRAFIEAVEAAPSVRDYIMQHHKENPALREQYNAAVDGVERFRSTHLEYAHTYIIKQNQAGSQNPNDVGTGGTPFAPYLKTHRDETTQHRIR